MSKQELYKPIWQQQSPIDLVMNSTQPVVFPRDYLVIGYPNRSLTGYFKDHNFWFEQQSPLMFDGQEASLERLHIHAPSEHKIDGKHFDFEIHFVNPLKQPTGGTTTVVIGVFFKVKRGSVTPLGIKALDETLKARAATRSATPGGKIPGSVNPSEFLPVNRDQFFRYEGSLTTGDFEQVVSWFVMPNMVHVAPKDVEELRKHAEEDAREVQKIDRRFVLRNFV